MHGADRTKRKRPGKRKTAFRAKWREGRIFRAEPSGYEGVVAPGGNAVARSPPPGPWSAAACPANTPLADLIALIPCLVIELVSPSATALFNLPPGSLPAPAFA